MHKFYLEWLESLNSIKVEELIQKYKNYIAKFKHNFEVIFLYDKLLNIFEEKNEYFFINDLFNEMKKLSIFKIREYGYLFFNKI